MKIILFFIIASFPVLTGVQSVGNNYKWKHVQESDKLSHRVQVPADFSRTKVQTGSFAEWLRDIPVKKGNPPVHLYNGKLKYNQRAQYLVADIDVGSRDLQQCADAVMRLRAEYLYATKQWDRIHFNFTSGDPAIWKKWAAGYRCSIKGNKVSWNKTAQPDDSYTSFRKYLDLVFTYAGTASLNRELALVNDPADLRAGDVFILGGSPGHAVLIMDVCENKSSGEKKFLLLQSYMPAQEMHVLKNPKDAASPWYSLKKGEELVTPEWTFPAQHLKRWKD